MSNLSLMACGKTRDWIWVGVVNLLSLKASNTSSGTYKSFHKIISTIINMNIGIKWTTYWKKRQRKPKGTIKNWQPREISNTGHTRRRKSKLKHNTICVRHHYMQTNANNVNKTWALLQTTESKYEPNIVFMQKS